MRYPFKSNKYLSSSVISIGYSILVLLVLVVVDVVVVVVVAMSVELFSVVLSVECKRVIKVLVGAPTTVLENARIVLAAAVEVVVVAALLLVQEDEKAKARTAGVSCRLVKQNIQRSMDRLRAAKNAEKGGDDGIQF